MRKRMTFLGGILLMLCCVMPSCKEDVDLSNIDTTMAIDMGIALPVGTIEATLGDFIGNEAIASYVEVNPTTGIIEVKYNTFVRWSFHPIDLGSYSIREQQDFYLGKAVMNGAQLPPSGFITFPESSPIKYVDFPCTISLDNFNTNEEYEKIDSIHILEAHFMSNIDFIGFTPAITESNITGLEIVFDNQSFRFDNGSTTQEIPTNDLRFGEDMDITLRQFNLIPQLNSEGKLQDATFTIRIYFQTDQLHAYTESSVVRYSFGLNFIDYDVIYGVFEPRKATEKLEVVRDTLSKYLPMDDIKGMNLPFSDPQIKLTASTSSVGLPCMLIVKELYVENEKGEQKHLQHPTLMNEMLGYALPAVTSPYSTDSATLAPLKLSKDEDEGKLDEMFSISPLYFGYSYYIKVNRNALTYSTFIKSEAEFGLGIEATLPLSFNEGLSLSYRDTMPLSIEPIQIDTLIASIPLIDSLRTAQLMLRLVVENSIPFDFGIKLRCLDEYNNIVTLAGLYDNGANDSITFAAFNNNQSNTQALNIALSKEDLDKLPQVRAIYYDIFLGNNKALAALKATDGLRIKVGLSGEVGANLSIDLDGLLEEDEDEDDEFSEGYNENNDYMYNY